VNIDVARYTGAPFTASPFDDMATASITPLAQVSFTYGVLFQHGAVTLVSTGSTNTTGGVLNLITGTGAAGGASFLSRSKARHVMGQGAIARFTAPMTAGVANSTQIAGVGDTINGYFIGFNGASFGVLHRNNSVDTWVAQASWNGDKCDGNGNSFFNWDKTLGVPVQICYAYANYGNVTFWVQDPRTSAWILFHTLKYANTSAVVELSQPCLGLYANVVNTGNTSSLTLTLGAAAIFACGAATFTDTSVWATDFSKSAVTAETNIISLRNATTFNGATNRGIIRIRSLSLATTSNAGIATLRMRTAATIGGSPSFAPAYGSTADNGVTITSGYSIASVDTTGTTATGGIYNYCMAVGSSGNETQLIHALDRYTNPGDTLTLSVFSTASTNVTVGVVWTEDI
jgi:hypothetical protein